MMEIGCDRSDERDGEQRQRQRSRSPPGSKEGGCYGRKKQGEFHSSFSLLQKKFRPESLKALARQLQSPAAPSAGIIHCSISCMEARCAEMRRKPDFALRCRKLTRLKLSLARSGLVALSAE
jgi:hypothetical protein